VSESRRGTLMDYLIVIAIAAVLGAMLYRFTYDYYANHQVPWLLDRAERLLYRHDNNSVPTPDVSDWLARSRRLRAERQHRDPH
jgi:hypothetical protein